MDVVSFLGEVDYADHVLTFRSSIIGRELQPKGSLIDWFISQNEKEVSGFKNAIYSGFPTKTVADIIKNVIIPNTNLSGVYNVSSEPINKYDLLGLTKDEFGLNIKINENVDFKIDRSLDSSRFRKETGFTPAPWSEMIKDLNIDSQLYTRE